MKQNPTPPARPKKQADDPAMLALLYPFDRDLAALDADASVLIANPVKTAEFPLAGPERADLWQWWKGAADALTGQGRILPAPGPDETRQYDAVLIRLPRQREEGQYLMATAWDHLKPGGLFMVSAANDTGGARLEKDLGWLSDPQSASKYKCRVVWGKKDEKSVCPPSWRVAGALQKSDRTGFWTQAGLFSWDRIDPATAMLLPYLPKNFTGAAADLGCGYGVLSLSMLERNPALKKLYCIDADGRALRACEKTIGEKHPAAVVEYHWADLSRPTALNPVDLVVMNPPFHAEKALAIDIGQSFITNAAALLKKQGELLMVANAHLPYEALLAKSFSHVEKKFEGQGFKIFTARK